MPLTLYYDSVSGPARSVVVFLDFIKDTTVQRKFVSLLAKEQLKQEFIDINPFHTVPTLHDEESGLVLYESIAILQYLAEKLKVTGKFGIPTEEKARWQVLNALHNQPHFMGKAVSQQVVSTISGPFFSGKPFEIDALRSAVETTKERFAILDAILKKNGGFVAGSSPTVADVRTFIDVFHVSNVGGENSLEVIDFSKDFPEIQKWLLAVKEDLFNEETWASVRHVWGPVAEGKLGGPVFRIAKQ